MDFQESWEIELSRGDRNRKLLNTFAPDGSFDLGKNEVKMRCIKNSLGTDDRRIAVEVVWWHQKDPDGEVRQYTVWDWHSATTNLLLGFEGERRNRVKEVVNIQKQKGDLYHCQQLGIPKSSPISASEMGIKVAENTEVREALRDLFGIGRITKFVPGEDYLTQIKAQEAAFAQKMKMKPKDTLLHRLRAQNV
jgi:hypothetical protein